MDGRGQFSMTLNQPMGQIPVLPPAPPQAHTVVLSRTAEDPLVPLMPSPAQAAATPQGNISVLNTAPANTVNAPAAGTGIGGVVQNIVSKVTGSDNPSNNGPSTTDGSSRTV